MNPGLLDRRLSLLQRAVTADGAGSPVETWSDAGILWGQRVEVRGNEAQSSGANRSTVAASYRVRYRSDLAAADASGKFRVHTDGRDHDILSALEDASQPRRSYMLLSLSYVQGEPTLTSVPVIE
jgi:SPP1 family predicted phage head-tail adaptor